MPPRLCFPSVTGTQWRTMTCRIGTLAGANLDQYCSRSICGRGCAPSPLRRDPPMKTRMPDDKSIDRSELLALTAEIVAAHVGNNAVAGADVGTLIQSVFDTLRGLGSGEPGTPVELTPAVPIRRSVTDDHIVCLEDGKRLKMLKRHLMTGHGMTPEDYRARWGLKPDYPMVAPNYSVQRQVLAKKIGLGRKPAPPLPPQPKPRRRRKPAA